MNTGDSTILLRQTGTIKRGMLANLMITDGDLFDEKTKIKESWVAGERFEFDPEPIRDAEGTWTLRARRLPVLELIVKGSGSGN